MTEIGNSILIQGASLQDLERMINRAVDERMQAFYQSIREQPDPLIKRQDAAKRLGVSLPTLDKYAKYGMLHPKHLGGMVYYAQSELDSHLFNNKNKRQ